MTRLQTTHNRRGFATFTAVALISIVGMALLALTLRFGTEVKRTAHHRTDTQTRQLLIAGAAIVMEAVSHGPVTPGTQPVVIPEEAGDAQLTIGFALPSKGTLVATIRARTGPNASRQLLTFSRNATGWTLQDVELMPNG